MVLLGLPAGAPADPATAAARTAADAHETATAVAGLPPVLDLRLRPEDVTGPARAIPWLENATPADAQPASADGPSSLGAKVEPRRGDPGPTEARWSVSGIEENIHDLVEHSLVRILATVRF